MICLGWLIVNDKPMFQNMHIPGVWSLIEFAYDTVQPPPTPQPWAGMAQRVSVSKPHPPTSAYHLFNEPPFILFCLTVFY